MPHCSILCVACGLQDLPSLRIDDSVRVLRGQSVGIDYAKLTRCLMIVSFLSPFIIDALKQMLLRKLNLLARKLNLATFET